MLLQMHGIMVQLHTRASDILEAHAMVQNDAGVYTELRDTIEDTLAHYYYEKPCEIAGDVSVKSTGPILGISWLRVQRRTTRVAWPY